MNWEIIGLVIAALGGALTALMRQYKIGPWNPMASTDESITEMSLPVKSPTASETNAFSPLSNITQTTPKTPNIALQTMCEAIRDFEGKPGDLNYQLNNPGDCRPSPVGYLPKYQPVEIIDTDTDPRYPFHIGKFAKFPTYELGWEYLQAMVHIMATNHPNWTLIDFFNHFAPASDGSNDPNKYAKFVANRLSVIPTATLKSILG